MKGRKVRAARSGLMVSEQDGARTSTLLLQNCDSRGLTYGEKCWDLTGERTAGQ